MNLRESKQAVRNLLSTFSYQKLIDVYAHNQSNNMSYQNSCSCLRGVATSDVIHTKCGSTHYISGRGYKDKKQILLSGEVGYRNLGHLDKNTDIPYSTWTYYTSDQLFTNSHNLKFVFNELLRQTRLSAIIRAVIRLRERQMRESEVLDQELVCQ
jgi:hypothetical protein